MYCNYCGADVGAAKFCGKCGAPIPSTEREDVAQQAPEQKGATQYQYAAQPNSSAMPVQRPKKKKGCIITFIIVLVFLAVAVVGCMRTINKERENTVESGTTQEAAPLVVDASQFSGKNLAEIEAIVGKLERDGGVDLIAKNGTIVKADYYLIPGTQNSFAFIDGTLIRYQHWAEEPIAYKSEKDIFAMFGIKPAANMKQEANTGSALRYSSVSEKVSEFHVQMMDSKAKTVSVVKITYDSNFGGENSG